MKKFLSVFIAVAMLLSLVAPFKVPTASAAGEVVTNPATGITSTSATLNATVGGTNAADTAFWWGPTNPGLISDTSVWATLSGQGWSSWALGSSVPASTTFSHSVTGLTPNTTYYFVAWVQISGTWNPGSVLSFTTLPPVSSTVSVTLAASTKTLYYYKRPDNSFATNVTWAYGSITGTRVYTMGSPITVTATGLAVGTVRAEIYNAQTNTATGSYTELFNSVANNTLTFDVPSANVNNDGPYFIRITDTSGIKDSSIFYIQYNLPTPTVNIPQCIGKQATISGYLTRASGYPLTADVWVWVVDAISNKLVAVNKIPQGQPTGQYFLTWVVQSIGDYRLGVSDFYPSGNPPTLFDFDGMVYKTFSNIPANYSITVSTYIDPTLLYKDQANQPVLVKVYDNNNQPVTGPLNWTVTNANVSGYSQIAPGFYRFVITPVAGKVDVRFSASYVQFGHTYSSNLLIINLRDRGQFNPYVDINTSNSPYFFQEIATVVYDKLPCQIGYSFDIIPGLWEPAQSDKFVVHDSSFEVTGPVYELVSAGRTVQIGGTMYPVYKLDELGEGSKYFVYDQGDIKVHFEAVIWERISENCEISKYNACCHNYSKDVSICSVQTCPAVTPTLSDGTTTVEVGKETGLKFSVSNKTAPTDLECGCDWKIYMMYMTDQEGKIINNAFKIKTRFGTTKNVSILLYNAVYDKYYSLGGYWLGLETRIPDLFTTFVSTYFGAGDPDLDVHDRCEVVDIAGVTFNYTNEPVYDASGVNISNHLVMKLFGTKVVTSTCGNNYEHPATYIGIDDISIVASQTDLVTEPTLTEGAQDPTQILAGVIPVIDVVIKDPVTHTVPGFSVDKGLSYWEDIVWEFYFNGKPLTGINVTVQPLDAQKGYRFALDKGFSKAGTFKIVGTSYYKDPTKAYNDFTKKEVATVEFEVVVPTFNVEIGLLDGTRIASDGILTEGFGEIIYVTPTDPRTDIQHDFAGDTWTLTPEEFRNDCGLATSYVCSGIIPNLCCGKQAIKVTAFDNPCVEEEPTVDIYFNLNGAKIKVTSLKVVPPTIKVSLEDKDGNPLEKAPVTIPPTNTHVIVTVKDAHNHGAPDVKATLGVESISSGSSGYVVTYGNSVSTNKNGEADFISSFMSGKYYVSVDAGSKCELPCANWTGIATELAFEAEYVKPVLDTTAPTVTVTAPAEVKTSTVKITGKATDIGGVVVSVWVGAKQVPVAPDGTFEAVLELVPGDNTFTVSAYDAAGNAGTASVTVKYVVPQVTTIVIKIGDDIMKVNGKAVALDVPAEIKNGRTFLPFRALAEAIGATVTWVPETQGVMFVLGDTQIGLQIGNDTAVINGNVYSIEPPYIKNGRTMVPVRFIIESFKELGAKVDWDSINRIVTITMGE